jgi:hypothetical protein
MDLEVGGRRVQSRCDGVELAEELQGSLAKICSMLLEVRAGHSPWNCAGEALEPQLQGAGQDHPLKVEVECVESSKLLKFVPGLSMQFL